MTDKLHDIISEAVCDILAEWGTTAKVNDWDNRENVPLREVMNQQCGPLIDRLIADLSPLINPTATYRLIAYKSNGSYYSRGCEMERWGSDFDCSEIIDKDALRDRLAGFMYRNTIEDGSFELLIFRNGIKVFDTETSTQGFTWDGYSRSHAEYNSEEHWKFEARDDAENAEASAELIPIVAAAKELCEKRCQEEKLKKQQADQAADQARKVKEKEARRQRFAELSAEFGASADPVNDQKAP